MATPQVDVKGLRDVQLALKRVDKELPKEIRTGMLPIATMVVGAIRPKVERLTGAAQASVRPRATQRGAGIAFGGPSAPHYPWLDFGGSVGRPSAVSGRGTVHRPFIKGGRYVFPTIEEKRPDIEEAVEDVVVRLAKRAQMEVR